MPEALKVLIVDDSAIYRSLVQGCLREMPDLTCVGTATTARTPSRRPPSCAPTSSCSTSRCP
jgi:chemotaxis response regulator CheB